MKADMLKAARLTREGRLADAMRLLKETLAPAPAHKAAAPPTDPVPARGRAAHRSVVDLVPPVPGSDGAWTAARSADAEPRIDPDAGPASGPRRVWHEVVDGFRKQAMPDHGPRTARPRPDPTFGEGSHAGAAGSRDYRLYVPAQKRGRSMPLVVMLHGCTQTPEDFAAGTGMNALAEQDGFLVAYPAQPRSANASRCWNWFNPGDQQRDVGEPALIAGITRQIMREQGVLPGRVYVAGLSAGGAAAAVMGALYPDLYAAIGVHSGLACGAARDVASAFSAMRQGGRANAPPGAAKRIMPAIVFHGDADATVHPANGDEVITQARGFAGPRAAGLDVSVHEGRAPGGIAFTCTVHADRSGRSLLEHWLLHGAGHAWSGGSAAGSYTEPRGPDASGEMIRFFRQHEMRQPG